MVDPRWGQRGSAATVARIALWAALAGCGGSSPQQQPDGGPPDGGGAGGTTDAGADTTPAPAPATVGEACQQLDEAIAQRSARCSGGTLADWRMYEATFADCAAYERHAAEGFVEYHLEAWAACLQKFQAPCT